MPVVPVVPVETPPAAADPRPQGDIGEQLARELGIALPHQDTVPGSFASIDDVETPHWKAVTGRLRPPDDAPPQG